MRKIDQSMATFSSQFLLNREQHRNRVLTALATGKPLQSILDLIVEWIEAENPDSFCSVLILDRDGEHLLHGSAPSMPEFYNRAVHGLAIGPGVGSCGEAAHSGQRVMVEDIQTHPNWEPFRDLARKAGLRACWAQPIFSSSKAVIGTFAIYHAYPRCPDDSDIERILVAAEIASLAIEHKQAEEGIKEARDQFRTLTENIPGLSYHCKFDEHWTALYVSEGAELVTGYPARDFIKNAVRTLDSLVHPEDTGFVGESIHTSVAQGKGWDIEYRIFHRDGEVRWVHEKGQPIFDRDGNLAYLDGFVYDITESRRQTAFQDLVATISTDFVNTPIEEADGAIHRALERIGHFFEADRTYIFRFSDDERFMDNTHEWCAPGVAPQSDRIRQVPLETYSWCTDYIRRQEPLHIPDVETLPPKAANELAEFRTQSIRSLLMLPLSTDGHAIGFYGLDLVHTTQLWNETEIRLLQVVAEIIASALARRRTEKIRQNQARLQSMVAEISAEMVNLFGEETDNAIDRALGVPARSSGPIEATSFVSTMTGPP